MTISFLVKPSKSSNLKTKTVLNIHWQKKCLITNMSLNSTSDEDSFSRVWRKGQRSSFPNSRSFTASLSRAFKPCTRERCWRRRHCIFVLRWSLFILASRHSSTERPLSMAMHAGQGSTTSTEVGKKTLENIYRG